MIRSEKTHLEPLGDHALLATCADESSASRYAAAVRQAKLPGVVDVVLSYVTVAVFLAGNETRLDRLSLQLQQVRPLKGPQTGRLHEVPCCYDFELDMARVAALSGLSPAEIVQLHTSVEYAVYAVGFCPGFPYLGYLPQALTGVPRLDRPRLRVDPGSVGLTGKQTGIYPLPTPGGWNIIGRTPLELVNMEESYFPITAGDRVRFQAIEKSRFDELRGSRLPV